MCFFFGSRHRRDGSDVLPHSEDVLDSRSAGRRESGWKALHAVQSCEGRNEYHAVRTQMALTAMYERA
jgi:hypothetical protein